MIIHCTLMSSSWYESGLDERVASISFMAQSAEEILCDVSTENEFVKLDKKQTNK